METSKCLIMISIYMLTQYFNSFLHAKELSLVYLSWHVTLSDLILNVFLHLFVITLSIPAIFQKFFQFLLFLLWINYIIPSTWQDISLCKSHLSFQIRLILFLSWNFLLFYPSFQIPNEELLCLFFILSFNIVVMFSWIYFPYDYALWR